MNKRSFIKLLSAMIAARAMPTAFAGQTSDRLKNWAGNLEYGTDRLYSATSLGQVRDYVKSQRNVKVLGTRHCFNNIADTPHNLLSLRPLDEVVELNSNARTVTVEAGITYGQLSPYLHTHGFALHNLASLPHISVAGACTTASHGSGDKNGNLSTAVSALEFVTASGKLLEYSRQRDGEKFLGDSRRSRCSGCDYQSYARHSADFLMQQYVYENLPLSELVHNFDAIESSAYSVSLFTDWQKQRINEVWIKSRLEPGRPFQAVPAFFGAKLASKNMHPIAELSPENCTEQLGVPGPWYERLPHFRMGFTPSAGKELQSEYFVPRQHAVEAILAIERLRDQICPTLLISEIRAIAADDLWLSPCYKQPSVTIHFTWKQNWPSVKMLLPLIEKELAPFNPRPHWGKLFTISPATLRSSYEKLPDFIQLAANHDPQGKFRNEFLNKNIFGS